jgi:hypothetical protein
MTIDDGLTTQQGMLLIQESDSAKHLLAYGLRALRLAAFQDTTRDPVRTMLSIGTEKLMKVSLGLFHLAENRSWLSKQTLKDDYRHNIVRMEGLLREEIRANLNRATHRVHVEDLLAAVDQDPVWPPLVAALNRYGQEGRFYYLDALAENPQREESPEAFWEVVDQAALDNDAELTALFHASATDFSLYEAFNRGLNEAVAESLQRWWELVAMAGKQGVLGERGSGWGHDVLLIGRQVSD